MMEPLQTYNRKVRQETKAKLPGTTVQEETSVEDWSEGDGGGSKNGVPGLPMR